LALEIVGPQGIAVMRTLAFLYHDVVPSTRFELSGFQSADANIYKLDRAEFDRHLEAIASQNYRSAILDPSRSNSERTCLLTFDDGGRSAADYIAGPLARRDWLAYFFITTDYIGRSGFLDPRQICELRKRGHVIGTHSCSHPLRMAQCTAAQLDREWRDSVRRLEDILGERVLTASIPGGNYGRNVVRAAAAAGIRVLFNSEPVTRTTTIDGCLVIGRFGVQQGVPPEWVKAVAAGKIGPRLQRWAFWNAKKLMKAAGGELWLTARRNMLARRAARGNPPR
jgi:peptidoglycan/xylan/chitin deacetylase (PgdA/CDA1 family)